MAANSSYLPARDIRFAYLLVGECCEVGADPLTWRRHLLSQLSERTGAVASVVLDVSFDPADGGLGALVDTAVSVNQYTKSESELLFRCVQQMKMEENPLGPVLLNEAYSSGPVAAARQNRVSRGKWDRSAFRTQYYRPLGWDGMLMSVSPLSNTSFQCVNLSRAKNDGEFTTRQSQLLQVVVRELAEISSLRLAGMSMDSLFTLPPRKRQVMLALIDGDDEKQVALRLGISRNTVHEYVRRLFQRFQVRSRGQLLAIAARQLHALSLFNPDSSDPLWLYRRRSA